MKFFLAVMLAAGLLFAADPWEKNPQKWSEKDAQRILNSSPWAQQANSSFAAAADNEPPPPGPLPGAAQAGVGMAGPNGATDGKWDGGAGRLPRGGVPTLPILIRWDSALPIREAAAQLASKDPSALDAQPITEEQASKDYVITLFGLVPAKRYRDAGQIGGNSNSNGSVDARDPEELLEGLMASSRLVRRGKPAIAPENVRLDGATGVLRIFFPRANPITANEREVLFTSEFGSITVRKSFRMENMMFLGRLEL